MNQQPGPQGVANPLPMAPPEPEAGPHRTFASYFQDVTRDGLSRSWAQVLRRFDDAATVADTLLSAAVGTPTTPSAYLCCASLHANVSPRVFVVHTLSRFPATALDGNVTPWDNQIFGYLGDMIQGIVATVSLPVTAFNLTNHAWVHDLQNLPDVLALLQDPVLLPRIPQAIAGAEQLRTRHLMYLPSRFVHLLLSNRGYTPKETYLTLQQAFFQDMCQPDDVQPIMDWLRLSLYRTEEGDAGPPVTNLILRSPVIDEDLAAHRSPILNHLISLRQDVSTGLEVAINHMATAVTQQATEVNRAQMARAIEREAPVTPATKFGLLLDSLKNYLHIEDEQDLPEFWFQFAAATRKQEFSVLRDYLELYARSENAFISTAPILSPKLHADLASITFVVDHLNDLKSGIQLFIAMDGSEGHRAASLELARSYGLLYERDHGVSLADLNQLKVPKELRSFPISFFYLERNLGLFGNLIGAVLGDAHPITTAYRTF
jgi:hypothetical protein